jgi:hypothetical protein
MPIGNERQGGGTRADEGLPAEVSGFTRGLLQGGQIAGLNHSAYRVTRLCCDIGVLPLLWYL